jgi:hypothetical protein
MSVQESSATALVRFTGLGIICFNDDLQRGEIAVIRDNNHVLTISIQQPVYQEGGEADVILYQAIATYQQLPKDEVQIEIEARGTPPIAGYEVYQSGEFDRLDSSDINDFRWIVNMNALHGDAALSPTAEGAHPLTKLYVRNGLFYTHKLDTDLFFKKVETDASGEAVEAAVFGNVGETVGVKIEGDEVHFTIRIGDQEETHSLARVEGLPFRIEIKNMDPREDAAFSDMADYYGYLASPQGNKFDLTPIIESADGETVTGAVNHKQFCHPIVSNLSSIDQL